MQCRINDLELGYCFSFNSILAQWAMSYARAYDIAHCARMELNEKQYPNSKSFILHCMGKAGYESVNIAIEERFGVFEWLRYESMENSDEHKIE